MLKMLPLFLIGIFWETGIADCLANTRSVQEKLDGATAVFSGKVVSLSTISENPDIPGTFLDKYVVLAKLVSGRGLNTSFSQTNLTS